MPRPNWTHTCRKTGRTKRDGKPFRCWRCFGQAEFAGWGSSVVEMMGGYQREHGLKCLGPHRPLADEVFAGAFTRCDACGGSGYVDDGSHQSWALCEACDGFGRRPAVSEEDIERRRAIVLEAFPDAARPLGRRRASSSCENAGPVFVAPLHTIATNDTPDWVTLVRAVVFVLVLAPGWLFASISAFRGGQVLVGTVLFLASAFAALSGVMTASPSSFGRAWMWVCGALGVGLLLLLGIIVGQAACAG